MCVGVETGGCTSKYRKASVCGRCETRWAQSAKVKKNDGMEMRMKMMDKKKKKKKRACRKCNWMHKMLMVMCTVFSCFSHVFSTLTTFTTRVYPLLSLFSCVRLIPFTTTQCPADSPMRMHPHPRILLPTLPTHPNHATYPSALLEAWQRPRASQQQRAWQRHRWPLAWLAQRLRASAWWLWAQLASAP
jgi:hypothetical protein